MNAAAEKRRKVVVTGLGCVTGFGAGCAALLKGMQEARSAVGKMTRFDASALKAQIAAEAPLLHSGDSKTPRALSLALTAAKEAIAQAGAGEILPKAGLWSSIGWEAPQTPADLDRWHREGARPMAGPGESDERLYREFQLGGALQTSFSACAASTQSIADAAEWIASAHADMILAGGADSRLHPLGILGYEKLGALATKWNDSPALASRPFARDRAGFVVGEGAAFLVLEEEKFARSRGAAILGEIAGWGSDNDAYRVTDPDPSGEGAFRAMQGALATAGVSFGEIDWISAHGTSTPANDRMEYQALLKLSGEGSLKIPVSAMKSMVGHTGMAAGAVETVGALLAMKQGFIPPTLNSQEPEFEMDTVADDPRFCASRYVLKNSFGFGGQNTCLLLRAR